MADREALRALQNRLAERMRQVASERPAQSWLAVDCGGQGMLFPLQQAGEIFALGAVLAVPHTRDWLAGVTNLRGVLYAVVDFAGFLGLRRRGGDAAPDSARLVSLNSTLGVNGALLVDRLEGLRHAGELQPAEETGVEQAQRPAFARRRWRDAGGRLWQEINLAELAGQDRFLAVAR